MCVLVHASNGPADVIKLQLVEAGLVECLLDVVAKTVDGEREEDVTQLKTASDLMVLLLLGGKYIRAPVKYIKGFCHKSKAHGESLSEAFTSLLICVQMSQCRSCLKEEKAAFSRGSFPGYHPITTSCSSPGL